MTDVLKSIAPTDRHYRRAQYALTHGMSLLDFDEWCHVCDVLRRDADWQDVRLMSKYILEYNDAHNTDYDWHWMDYPTTWESRCLFEDMIAYATTMEKNSMVCMRCRETFQLDELDEWREGGDAYFLESGGKCICPDCYDDIARMNIDDRYHAILKIEDEYEQNC